MKVKNRERIERMVISLEAILETDKLDFHDREYLTGAVVKLSSVCQRYSIAEELKVYPQPEDEFDEDDLRV
jgi:hypothetical protein